MSTLDNLRREAKQWLKALRSQDPAARARLAKAWPQAPAAPGLRDVQHALAREHGFESWTAFKDAIAARRPTAAPPHGLDDASAVDAFVAAACWEHHTHGANAYASHASAAMRLLAQYPRIASHDITTAVISGNLALVHGLLDADPALATTKGGPRGWEPLLYLCFARLPSPALTGNAVAIARVLLDRGADPNAYYMAGSAKYSALVGVAGEGEQDAPRDQSYKATLYRLLLERGAGPYDIQVLYNTHFSGDMQWWLELTYEHDVARGDVSAWGDPAWRMLDMGGYGPGAYFVLRCAIDKNDRSLAEWALAHGADPTAMSSTHPRFKPRHTLYEEAALRGRTELVELLVRHGATPVATHLDDASAFLHACIRGDHARVRELAAGHPEYLQSPRAIHAAAEADRVDVVELLLDLGTPLEIENDQKQRPLHQAAGANAVRVAQVLIARGAEIDPRETQWGSTPLGLAVYGNHREMIALLAPLTRSVWHLAWLGDVDRLRAVLAEEPQRAREVTPKGATPLMWLPDDDEKAEQVVEVLLAHGADASASTRHERLTAADYARQRGLERAARRLEQAAPPPPRREPSPSVERFERLARDLVIAFESGEPGAIQRLIDQFGGPADWERVRTGVRQLLQTVPEGELPGGYFSLPHARLVIARQAGFKNWDDLVALLGPRTAAPTGAIPPVFVPNLDPGMIQPIELKAGFRVRMADGTVVTTSQVWDMLSAARNGDLERVDELAAAHPALVRCDYNYMAPLHLAVREGHHGIVERLAERGAANPKYVTYPYRESLITLARDRGYEAIAATLESWYARDSSDRTEDESGEILYERDAERERFQRLVGLGAIDEVRQMLRDRRELALDAFAFWSEGILSMPANRRNRAMLELLMEHGARVPQVTKWGAWYYLKHADIAAFLMDRGMEAHHMNVHHTTLLHDMAYTGDVRKATLLVEHGADVDAIDEEFRSTPLGLAARFGKPEMVEFLLDRGADPNRTGAPWATPLEWAAKKGHTGIAAQLRAGGARAPGPRARPLRREEVLPPPAPLRVNPERSLPVRPDPAEIRRQVEELGGGEEARQSLARSYGAESWERLDLAVRLVDALWRDDLAAVRAIITAQPHLLHEDALIRANSNWGPPMTYAANLGRNRIIAFLHEQGARDLDSAMDRAVLQGALDTARMLYRMGAAPPDRRSLDGPAETLNPEGMALLVEFGVELNADTAPVEMVLGTYCRNPLGKHQILELFIRHGVPIPDTPPMAVHRGRIDLLEKHLRRDPQLLSRTFSHREMFPPELGCHEDETLALVGTPLGGSGLLNMAIEYGELEMAAWMVEHGADVNLRARVAADGFGGHTPLFNTVVTLYGGSPRHGEFAKLLLARGADPFVRASLRKALRGSDDDSEHQYHDVTALEWGDRFHDRSVVNTVALEVLRRHVGRVSRPGTE